MYKIYDLEVLKNYFLCVSLSLEGDNFDIFEISKFKNDLKKFVEFIKELRGEIGFNNLFYDSQIQQFVLSNYKRWIRNSLEGEQIASEIYAYSQKVIGNDGWPDFRERDLSVKQLDLFRVWHYNNKARSCSLKWLQYSMDWHNIEDMPIKHYTLIEDRETADSIISYCKNDCLSTKEHYNITIGKTDNKLYKNIDKIQLRKDVHKEFGFNCLNFSDVKIGDEIMKTNYCIATEIDKYDLKPVIKNQSFTFGDCFPDYISFRTKELNDFVDSIKDIKIDPENNDQKYKFKFGQATYTFAKGGIHSNDPKRVIIPLPSQILRDADVGSQYPNAIRKRKIYPSHLGIKWLEGYTDIINKRIESKRLYKETKEGKYKSFDEAFKLALNGGSFGKLNEKTNWQYDPFCLFQCTIGNQLEIMMLIEEMELSGIKVVSANTDGIVCLFDKELEDTYNRICEEWENKVGNSEMGKLEYADYKKLAQLSVNDYIAIKIDGTPKHKGDFMVDFELHKNKSFKIIPLALEIYYKDEINPTEFIRNHKNIFDFCAGIRAKTDWYFESRYITGTEEKSDRLQQTNRYYISNKGSKLMKCNIDGRQLQVDAGKWLSTIYNKHAEQDIEKYDINYDYYIKKVYNIISKLEPDVINEKFRQLTLF